MTVLLLILKDEREFPLVKLKIDQCDGSSAHKDERERPKDI
jgi:hypothetical protein